MGGTIVYLQPARRYSGNRIRDRLKKVTRKYKSEDTSCRDFVMPLRRPVVPTEPSKPGSSWLDLIRAVRTPLGFFVLVVLVVEALLGTLVFHTDGADRTLALSGSLGLIAALVGVVAVLAYYRASALVGRGPEDIHLIALQLEGIERTLRQLDQMARHGSSGLLVAALLALQDKVRMRAHCHAGGLTLSPILLETLPQTASGFYDMFQGNKHELKLTEHHVVDNFLRHLVKSLPSGSIWLGITRLTSPEAWHRKTANVAYFEFQKIAERRTREQELSYYRLWCFDEENDLHDEALAEIMREQRESGLQIRYVVGSPIEDISLIWIPRTEMAKTPRIKAIDTPIDEIEERADAFEPLCAIRFEPPRGGRELEEMTICSPAIDEFKRLCRDFQDNWRSATELAKEGKD
jgi:hypothetical protein